MQVEQHRIMEADKFLILGSDGVFDVLRPEQVSGPNGHLIPTVHFWLSQITEALTQTVQHQDYGAKRVVTVRT